MNKLAPGVDGWKRFAVQNKLDGGNTITIEKLMPLEFKVIT